MLESLLSILLVSLSKCTEMCATSYYYNSFVGRDYKGWMQMAIFILLPYLSPPEKEMVSSLKGRQVLHFNFNSLVHEQSHVDI